MEGSLFSRRRYDLTVVRLLGDPSDQGSQPAIARRVMGALMPEQVELITPSSGGASTKAKGMFAAISSAKGRWR